jgi:ADP-dependent NAD(P)H-hydrate dehydratase / NAD(P)H-hydrate epimerase
MLVVSGYNVKTYKILHTENPTADFQTNEKRLLKLKRSVFTETNNSETLPEINENDIVIDALFGSGLTRPLEGFLRDVVKLINNSKARVISIDLPSGLSADSPVIDDAGIIQADLTLSFQHPKLAFMFPENENFTGEWHILDIGLNQEFINRQDTPYYFMLQKDLQAFYKSRKKFDHKGIFGHALLIAGSYGKSGAAVMSSKAILLTGAGLLTVHIPSGNYAIQQSCVSEGMVSVDEDPNYFTGIKDTARYNAIGIGPGLGQEKQTQNAMKHLIQNVSNPMVFDADALNILSENPTWLSFIPAGSILTPHVGEFDRLAGKSSNGWERLEKARDFAFRYKCYFVLKGAHTAIIAPDKQVVFNSTGNPGMATAGTGDVLTGMILGLLAQGYSSMISAMMGVYLHGLAGDLASRKIPMESLVAGDVLNNIPRAIRKAFY